MRSVIIIQLYIVIIGTAVYADYLSLGSCPDNVPAVRDFDLNGFSGTWYEVGVYPLVMNYSCVKIEVIPKDNNKYFEMNTIYYKDGGVSNTCDGNGELCDPNFAKLDLTYEFETYPMTSTLWVLDIDYKEYALLYACMPVDKCFKAESGIMLSRTSKVSKNTLDKIYEYIDNNPGYIYPECFKFIKHDYCPYYYELEN